jgi:hypothetical protein
MDDIRKLILELTSSQRHEEIDVQTAAQLVSENDSVRRDLGGSFGVEAGKGTVFVCLNPNQSFHTQDFSSNLFLTCSFRVTLI